jgi:CheY-like chemotaxis protein
MDSQCKGIRILLAEDSPVGRKLMEAWFRILGCEADFAENGLEAVEKVRQNDYDVVLMDIMMPEMDGLEATRAIRESGRSELPIIALTAAVTKADLQKTQEAGMNDFLPKPVDPEQLQAKLLKWTRPAAVAAGGGT